MIYLDNAATSFPKPERVNEAVVDCLRNWCANPGRAGHRNAMMSGQMVFSARSSVAELIGAQASEIVFTNNCTSALNMGIRGILKNGDHVVVSMMEHNSVLRPLYSLKLSGIEISMVSCNEEGYPQVEAFKRACKKNTKLIICMLASNVTGTIMPIYEIGDIAKKRGIIFMVDGAQGLGSVPLNVNDMNIGILASSGHKSLLGPQGTGFLYIRKGIKLVPYLQGGTGTNSNSVVQPDIVPEGFESGTLNVPGIVGLKAGIDYISETGINDIQNRENSLMELLQGELSRIERVKIYGPSNVKEKSGVLAFNIENIDCEYVADRLNSEYGIAVRAGFHCSPFAHKAIGTDKTGCVRISVGPFNTHNDIIEAIRAIYEIAQI